MASPARNRLIRGIWIAVFFLVLAGCLAVRVRLLELPLERDEGEYAYAGQLMLNGIPPYKLAYNMKFPGTYAAYAAIMAVFGQTPNGIHLGYLLLNLTTVLLVILIGRHLFGWDAGLAAGASYAALSLSPAVLGFSAHATHFVVLPALAAVLLLLRPRLSGAACFSAGLLFGIGTMMKQPGICFAIFGALLLVYRQRANRDRWLSAASKILFFGSGVVLPFLLTCGALNWAGTFQNFWFWTIQYAADYGSVVPLSLGLEVLARNSLRALDHLWLVWLIATVGVIGSFGVQSLRKQAVFLVTFGFFSAGALSAGLYFRPHYFVLILPGLALGVAGAVGVVATRWPNRRGMQIGVAGVVLAACLLPFVIEEEFFFSVPAAAVCRRLYGANPFPEALKVAEFIRSRTAPSESIAVIGSEPEIYFYAQRKSATGYIYMYPAMEPQPLALNMQRQIIEEVESARPKYVVITGIDMSWKWPVTGTLLQDWADRFVGEKYRTVGLVNIISPENTDYYLPLTSDSAPVSENYLLICERR